MLLLNTHAIVTIDKIPVLNGVGGKYFNSRTLAGIVDRIVDKIAKNTIDERLVAINNNILGQVVIELHALFLECQLHILHHIAHQLRHIHTMHRNHMGCIVHTVENREVGKQRRESLSLHMGSLKKSFSSLMWNIRGREQGLGISKDACYRGLDFMSNVLCELSSHESLLHLLFLLNAFIHALAVPKKHKTQNYHHHYSKHHEVPVVYLIEWFKHLAIIIVKENKHDGINQERSHHANPHFLAF